MTSVAPTRVAHAQRDRGALIVLAAVLMVALLAMAAFVIDIGLLYSERRQLQNGADAAALAIAQSCAEGGCGSHSAQLAAAEGLADANANDRAAAVTSVCGVDPEGDLAPCAVAPPLPAGVTNYVRVATRTHEPSNSANPSEVPFFFGPFLDAASDGGSIGAVAVAAWGSLRSIEAEPLTFSECEYEALGGSIENGTLPSGEHVVEFHKADTPGCSYQSSSGSDFPGGFGWLATTSECRTELRVGAWVNGNTGNGVPNVCELSTWQDRTILLAVYDAVEGNGSHGQYRVAGIAAFTVTGYSFPGNDFNLPGGKCPGDGDDDKGKGKGSGSTSCLKGQFSHFVASGTIGTGGDYGVNAVQMVG